MISAVSPSQDLYSPQESLVKASKSVAEVAVQNIGGYTKRQTVNSLTFIAYCVGSESIPEITQSNR